MSPKLQKLSKTRNTPWKVGRILTGTFSKKYPHSEKNVKTNKRRLCDSTKQNKKRIINLDFEAVDTKLHWVKFLSILKEKTETKISQ